MRVENIDLMIKMPLSVDKPDANGLIYTKEALIKAFKGERNKPFEIIHEDGTTTVIGVVNNVEYIEDKNGDYALISVSLRSGGTCERVEKTDIKNMIITSMELCGIGPNG